ncbi:FAD/NAD(P)-binding protein [Streptomyces sp. NPDC002677]|uniref:FAD/NAD(P)-binding protein n=1 Tax=Streptomyces sp. NPDC002677 TaxID=3154774 RepID=UPI00333269F4
MNVPSPAAPRTPGRLDVCLVGMGPRGLAVLERITANAALLLPGGTVTVHVVDPFPPGAGAVWRTDQPRELLMNTVSSQVTVFADDSVEMRGPVRPGPSLHEWARFLTLMGPLEGQDHPPDVLAEACELGPDDYPTRALYGHYLRWAFRRITVTAAGQVKVRTHRSRAVALDDGPGGRRGPQTVRLADGTELTGLDAVVLAQGHVPVRVSGRVRALRTFAARHDLHYIPPANPADVDTSGVRPGEAVLLRGLGLNFFDHMALFTVVRGGRFERSGGRLVYRPSGREPRLYAGSRRGVPYHARGENEKGPHGRHLPRLLTERYVATLRARAGRGERIDFGGELWPLIAVEAETVYYEALLRAAGRPIEAERAATLYAGAGSPAERARLLDDLGIDPAARWDWERIARPYGNRSFTGSADFRAWTLAHLDEDVRQAGQGNVNGPVKAALDVLRDLRNEVRLAVDHAGLDGDSYRDELEGWYTPLNAFLSIGPPARRVAELAALIRADVLGLLGPEAVFGTIEEGPAGPAFTAHSPRVADSGVSARVLVDARLPGVDLRAAADPLLGHLLDSGQCAPYRIAGRDGTAHTTGGLAVTPRPYRVVDARGRSHPRRFAYGVPTEGVHWATAAGIRPGVNSVTLADADAIAHALFSLPPAGPSLPGSVTSLPEVTT